MFEIQCAKYFQSQQKQHNDIVFIVNFRGVGIENPVKHL